METYYVTVKMAVPAESATDAEEQARTWLQLLNLPIEAWVEEESTRL